MLNAQLRNSSEAVIIDISSYWACDEGGSPRALLCPYNDTELGDLIMSMQGVRHLEAISIFIVKFNLHPEFSFGQEYILTAEHIGL